jgi:hypothetical protein
MPDNANRRQPVSNLQRKLIEIEIRIEEITLILSPLLKHKLLSVLLRQEMFLPRRTCSRQM